MNLTPKNRILLLAMLLGALAAASAWLYWRPARYALVAPPAECQASYQRFFAKDEIELRIVFGYKDARPARFVGDRYERLALLASLLKSCSGVRADCGFQRSPSDGDLLEKMVRGPDRRLRRIKLWVTSSAASPDDRENARDPFQKWKSREAKRRFLAGLQTADAVFYDGHSRDGGGPDFSPPRLSADGHVDYAWYRSFKPGLKEMQKQVAEAKSLPKLVGLYSCVSNHLVPISRRSGHTAWITFDQLLYFAEALQSMEDSLSSLLGAKCPRDFARGSSMNLSGFF